MMIRGFADSSIIPRGLRHLSSLWSLLSQCGESNTGPGYARKEHG